MDPWLHYLLTECVSGSLFGPPQRHVQARHWEASERHSLKVDGLDASSAVVVPLRAPARS